MKTYLYLCLLIVGVVSACRISFEKRRFNKGYHVEISRKYKAPKDGPSDGSLKEEASNAAFTETTESKELKNTPKNVDQTSISSLETNLEPQKVSSTLDLSQSKAVYKPNKSKSDAKTTNSASQPSILHASFNNQKKSTPQNRWFYAIPIMTIATTFGAIVAFKNRTRKLAKWARRNPKKSRLMIAIGHFAIGVFGYEIGKELYEFGFVSSSYAPTIFSGTLVGAAGLLYLAERRSKILLWQAYFKQKFLHLIMTGSFLGSMITIGNSIQYNAPQSTTAGHIISTFHQLDHVDKTPTHVAGNPENDGNIALIILFVFLIIVVAVVTVVAACMVWCNGSTLGAIMIAILGAILIGVLISAIIKVSQKIRETEKSPT